MGKIRWVTTGLYGGGGHWVNDDDQKYWVTTGLYGGGGHYRKRKRAISWEEYYRNSWKLLPPDAEK